MNLSIKFNIVLVVSFLLGLICLGIISYHMLKKNSREEILDTASLIMQSALAIRGYTVNEVRPLLAPHMTETFYPQTVPAYAATKNIYGLRKIYPEYSYKEATLNPTNPASRATDWESTIIEYFRNNDKVPELIGEHETAVGPSLFIARPIRVSNSACLNCHGKSQDAPRAMLARYGDNNGFGWKLDEIVGAQIVKVPMSVAQQRSKKVFVTFMISLTLIFALIILLINVLLRHIVVKPIKDISSLASYVSMGNLDAPEFNEQGGDELATLGKSFNRMRRSLDNAMRMIDD